MEALLSPVDDSTADCDPSGKRRQDTADEARSDREPYGYGCRFCGRKTREGDPDNEPTCAPDGRTREQRFPPSSPKRDPPEDGPYDRGTKCRNGTRSQTELTPSKPSGDDV